MKLLKTYFLLELKKGIRIIGKSISTLAVVLLTLVMVLYLISKVFLDSGSFLLLNVGIVLEEEDASTELVTNYISSMESVSSVCKFVYMTEEEAKRGLNEGSIQAYIRFPKDVYHDIDSGENTPAMVYFPREASSETQTFQELLVDAVTLLQKSEAAIYASFDESRNRVTMLNRSEMGDILFRRYLELTFSRGDLFLQTVQSSIGDQSFLEYYFAAGIAIFLVFCGIFFGSFYRKQEQTVEQVLHCYGLSKRKQNLVKISTMTLLLWFLSSLIYIMSCGISFVMVEGKLADTTFIQFHYSTLFQLIFLCFSIASFFHMIYQIGRDGLMGTVTLLLGILWMLMISGVIIPIVYLPKWAGVMGQFMPLTFWNRYCSQLFFAHMNSNLVAEMLGIGLIEIIIGELIVWRNS